MSKQSNQNNDINDFKIAILASFTFSSIKEALTKKCKKINISPQFYFGKYNQYTQEILDRGGGLYNFNPSLIIIFIDIKTLLGDLFFQPYQISNDKRKIWAQKTIDNLRGLIKMVLADTSAKVIFHNFEVPAYSPLGILENKQEFGFIESIELINENLKNTFKSDNRVFIFNYNEFCSRIGKENIVDPKMYYLGDIKLAVNHLPALCHEYLSYIKPMCSLSKKCIVLDLDNTLWGGIIGEDGLEGIKLGPTPGGRSFLEFQKHLLSLQQKGILLAINSKNNPDDVAKVFQEHPYMILRKEHFVSIKINWVDKVKNMKEIAKELNIGMDSFVFIDDDKVNRAMISEFLPEIQTIELPKDPALYPETLLKINDFNTIQLTEEDKQRGEMYIKERKREEISLSFQDLGEFIKSLNLKIAVLEANKFTIPRISQLTQKTNQFNTSAKRYSEEQIAEFADSDKCLIKCFKVEDKFGDYGITGVVIIKIEDKNWYIDTFLLSCRVLGKNIEFAIMAYIIKIAKEYGIKKIRAKITLTKKNKPVENFYSDCQFEKEVECRQDGSKVYIFDTVSDNYINSDYININ